MTDSEPVRKKGKRRAAAIAASVVAGGLVLLTWGPLASAGPAASDSGATAKADKASNAENAAKADDDHHPEGFNLIFGDEFNGTELDRSAWCTRFVWSGGTERSPQVPDAECTPKGPNGEKLGTLDTLGGDGTSKGQEAQVYRDTNKDGKKMHTVQDGFLSLHATATRLDQPFLKYESAMIRSKKEFEPTPGHPLYLTTRVRQPDVLGSWPAFWLASGAGDGSVAPDWPPEIDILESPYNNEGQLANVMHTGVITKKECGDSCPQGPTDYTFDVGDEFDEEWGNFVAKESLRGKWLEAGLEWKTDGVCYFVDGVKLACQKYKWVTSGGPEKTNPATVMLNLAVGGDWAGANGVDNDKFPMSFDIDHVRIYQK